MTNIMFVTGVTSSLYGSISTKMMRFLIIIYYLQPTYRPNLHTIIKDYTDLLTCVPPPGMNTFNC
jgi:hypothetical protein